MTKGDLIFQCIYEQARINRGIPKSSTFRNSEFSLENVLLIIYSHKWVKKTNVMEFFIFLTIDVLTINDKNDTVQKWQEKRQRQNHAQIRPTNLSTREKNSVSVKIIWILTPFAVLRTSQILLSVFEGFASIQTVMNATEYVQTNSS